MRLAAGRSNVRSWPNLQKKKMAFASADFDFGIGDELIGRQRQIERRRARADAAGGVVNRTVARTEKAVIRSLMHDRDTAKMRADADQDQPLVVAFLDARLIGLRIG